MGRDQLPVLPGAAQRCREQLHTGNTGVHPGRDAQRPQRREQAGRAGVKPGVAAVEHGSVLPGVLRQRFKDVGGLVERELPGGAVCGQARQQPLCAEHKARAAHSGLRLRGEGFPFTAAHTDQCDHCNIS